MVTGYSGSLVSTVLSGVLGVASAVSGWGRSILAVTNSKQTPQMGSGSVHPLQVPQHIMVNGIRYLNKCNQKYGTQSPDGYYECVDYNWDTSDLQYVAQSYSTVQGGSNTINTHVDAHNDIQTHYNHLAVRASPPSIRSEVSFRSPCHTYGQGDTVKFKTEVMAPHGWARVNGKMSKYSSIITQFKMPNGAPHSVIRLSNDGKLRLTYKGANGRVYHLGRLKAGQKTTIEVKVKHSMNNDGSVRVKVDGRNRLTLSQIKTMNRIGGGGYVKMGVYTQINMLRELWFSKTEVCKKL